jgi:hypothetical protein
LRFLDGKQGNTPKCQCSAARVRIFISMLYDRRAALLKINDSVYIAYQDLDRAAEILDDWGRRRRLDFSIWVPSEELENLLRALDETQAWSSIASPRWR